MGISIYNASAGSGKTHLLTHLLADLIKGNEEKIGKVKPERVIATTFTKAAAQEIRERASEVLLSQGMIEESFQLKDGLLGTVNSVCGALLERYSVFTKISPEIRVIEESERESLLNSFIGQTITSSLITQARAIGWKDDPYTGDAFLSNLNKTIDLLRYNNIKLNSKEEVVKLVNDSFDNNYESCSNSGESKSELHGRIDLILNNLLEDGKAFISSGASGSSGVKKDVVSRIKKEYLGSPLSNYLTYQLKVLNSINGKCPKGFKRNFEADHSLILDDVIEELTYSGVRKKELIEFATAFFEATLRILELYQNHKKNEGLIDFADQEFLFLDLLKNDFVRDDISASFDVVFVDEFQDTSPIQLAIFTELNKLVDHSIWIGDPKQSIYGFRGADSALMREIITSVNSDMSLQGVLEQKDGQLKTSYRSRKELVHFANTMFSDAFNDVEPENVILNPLENRLTNSESCELHIWCQPAAPRKTVINPSALANKIKETIESETLKFFPKGESVERTLKPGDICVLTRTNKSVSNLAFELSKLGVKVNAPIEGLIDQPEIFSLIAALKLIQNPNDKLSQLEILTVADSHGYADNAIEVICSNESEENEFLDTINNIRKTTRIQSISTQIETILCTTYFTKRLEGLENEFQALANIKALKQAANKYESYCENNGFVADNYGFELFLKQNNPDQGYALNEECVNIMTYHGSKGLEFPMVIMFDLHKEIKPSYGVSPFNKEAFNPSSPLANRSLDILLDDGLLKESVYNDMLEKQVDENKRLIYVGVTRARDFLVIPYREKSSTDNSQINLLSSAVNDKIGYPDLDNLAPGESILSLGEMSFRAYKAELVDQNEEEIVQHKAEVSIPNFTFQKTGHKRKLIGSGKDKIYDSPFFTDFKAESLKHTLSIEREKIELSDSDFGNVIHQLFLQAGNNSKSNIVKIINNWNLSNVLGTGDNIVSSYFQLKSLVEKKYSNISQCFFEKPFWFKKNEQELEGIIDLVFLTNDGWIIIDYKSHSNQETDLVQFSKAKDYLIQLNNYAEALNNYQNYPVIGAALYYPFGGEILWTSK